MKGYQQIGMKAIIAALAAAAAGYASAQSNVTVYGNIDIGMVKESGTTTRLDRGNNNWLGFKGTEDLGDGMNALFNVQMRFIPGTGAQEKPTLFQGETTVGLSSQSFGRVRFGRAYTPMWTSKWPFDPWYDTQFMGSIGAYQNGSYYSDPTNAAGYSNYSRIPNGVFYDSPMMAGFQVHAASAVQKTVGTAARTISFAINYGAGPFATALSYERNNHEDDIVFLGGSYNLGAFTVMGSYGRVQISGAPTSEKNYTLAGTYALGADTLRLGYGRTNDVGGTTAGTSQNKIAVGINHPLSKRTNLYADLYREKTTDDMNGIALGMNHSF